MKNISKPFAEWVTSFKSRPFLFARFKLTFFYTLGIFMVILAFNVIVFGLFVKDLPDHLEMPATELAEERLEAVLYLADGVIFIIVASMSYILAGITLKPIEQSYQKQRKFISDTAHELRTPLTVMKTGAQTILSSKAKKTDYQKLTKDSLDEINHLSTTVNDLLFFAKNDSLKKFQLAKFNLSKLLNRQLHAMQSHAVNQKISLTSNIEDNVYINGNKDYLKRLLHNLIGNAIDYNKPNGRVKVSLEHKLQEVEIKIVDTGIGISQKDLPRIFDRFYKADQARSKKSQGAGLGLSIVKEIVDLHQGQVSIRSKLKAGTQVTVLFPLP